MRHEVVNSRKKILIVGFVDSIHTVRWLKQFESFHAEFRIFPSSRFRRVHTGLIFFENGRSTTGHIPSLLLGLCDKFLDFLSSFFPFFSRSSRLARSISKFQPDIVHALEFQHSGYLCSELISKNGKKFSLMVSNWGSDIYYFQRFDFHRDQIMKLLRYADYYSAECKRDYELARYYGFRGSPLPLVPNTGGFSYAEILRKRIPAVERRLILVKGYGGELGEAYRVIRVLHQILPSHPEVNVRFYSLTQDLVKEVRNLAKKFPKRIFFTTNRRRVSHKSMQNFFDSARVYVGCSKSDGLSTSLLEAIVAGCYPIQTNTSCGNELVNRGAFVDIISLDDNEIKSAILKALHDHNLVSVAESRNREFARAFLEYSVIQQKAFSFYD
jgi:glycosyltransferase involved in cell wall biosynthesis